LGSTRTHQYHIRTGWQGNLGTGTSAYTAYSRNFDLTAAKKATQIAGSSDPAFRGDPGRYNPEELLLGAISSCHMLWVLHLCADAGIVITEYADEASGEMVEHPDGSGEFTSVTLRPRMVITDGSRIAEAEDLHHRANELCCLARSMAFPVKHEPQVVAVTASGSPS
jgi:organic hydroperoxide reductase OsmC/OhrA